MYNMHLDKNVQNMKPEVRKLRIKNQDFLSLNQVKMEMFVQKCSLFCNIRNGIEKR